MTGGVPPAQRVQLSPVQNAAQTKLIKGHKPTAPLLVFVAVLAAAITLALILENYRMSAAGEAGGPSESSHDRTWICTVASSVPPCPANRRRKCPARAVIPVRAP